jgi:hypothetical protein
MAIDLAFMVEEESIEISTGYSKLKAAHEHAQD